MVIITNTLAFNGGTTFILRLAKELSYRGDRLAVLVLINNISTELKESIEDYANIYYMSDFLHPLLRWSWRSQLAIFFPFKAKPIREIFADYGGHIHVMGVFGLLFAALCVKRLSTNLNVTVGIYHQNEFMFRVKSYLAQKVQRLFAVLDPRSVVFFNEANQDSYGQFFNQNYQTSLLVPIGIELPKMEKELKGSAGTYRIVSIGNLHDFKTYNLHIINCLPELLKMNPKFSYDIYGEGLWRGELEALVKKNSLENCVSFKGRVPYSEFADVLSEAFLFVGSGTAILEAGALGIPSLIGIESSKQPVTYGFLSEIEGFSYNEFTPTQQQFSILEKIRTISVDLAQWTNKAQACKKKAESFSIQKTADGFQRLNKCNALLSIHTVRRLSPVRLLLSFVLTGIKHKLKLDTSFSNRRNQGSLI